MPEISGYEIAQQIRAQSEFDDVPIIAISGYGGREHIVRSKAAGIDRHLLKPVDLTGLQEVICHELQKPTHARHVS